MTNRIKPSDVTLDHVWQALVWAEASVADPGKQHMLDGLKVSVKYDQRDWGGKTECGTACCIFGGAYLLAGGDITACYWPPYWFQSDWASLSKTHSDLMKHLLLSNPCHALPSIRAFLEEHRREQEANEKAR